MQRKAQRWYIKWPSATYAWGPQDFGELVSEREVRREILHQEQQAGYKGKRLPNGFACWPQAKESADRSRRERQAY